MYGVDVLFVSYSTAPAGLADVLQITALTSYFIDATVVIFIRVFLIFQLKMVLRGISSFIGNVHLCVSK
jgi:hypothetical protein